MVDSGINKDNEYRAMSLTLKLLSDYPPSETTFRLPGWLWVFVGVSLLILIISAFPPKTVLAIGRGAQSVAGYRRWLQLVTVTIPTLIVGGIVMPVLGEYIKTLF